MSKKTITHKFEIATEWCPKCDYENFRSFHTYQEKCPKCGTNLRHGAKLPHNPVQVSKSTGHYDWAHPNETQFQYYFRELPKGLKRHFVVSEELGYPLDDPLPVAEELKDIIDRYMFNPDKQEIDKVVEWLREHEAEQAKMRKENRIRQVEYELAELLIEE